MATPQTIIDAATAHISVRTPGVTFSTDNSSKNTDAFNALVSLMSQWAEDGWVDIPAPTTTSETLTVPEGTVRALEWALALELCPMFGKSPSPVLVQMADMTSDRIAAEMDIDIEVDMSDLNFAWRYNINTDR